MAVARPNPSNLTSLSTSTPQYTALTPDTIYSGFEPGPLAEQLSSHTPVPIPYKAPIDWARWGTFGAFALFFLFTLPLVAPFLRSRWTWAVGTIVTSLIMTSGYMFTRIRNTPFTSGGSWIAAGYQNQYGQETQVVAAICRFLSVISDSMGLIVTVQTDCWEDHS